MAYTNKLVAVMKTKQHASALHIKVKVEEEKRRASWEMVMRSSSKKQWWWQQKTKGVCTRPEAHKGPSRGLRERERRWRWNHSSPRPLVRVPPILAEGSREVRNVVAEGSRKPSLRMLRFRDIYSESASTVGSSSLHLQWVDYFVLHGILILQRITSIYYRILLCTTEYYFLTHKTFFVLQNTILYSRILY